MTLDEAIAHEREVEKDQKSKYDKCPTRMRYDCGMCFHNPKCNENAEYHKQLAKWLEAYKRLARETEQDIYERAYKDGLDKGLSDGNFFGYNKAIDDFSELLRETRDNRTLRVNCDDLEIRHMADRLKDGAGE